MDSIGNGSGRLFSFALCCVWHVEVGSNLYFVHYNKESGVVLGYFNSENIHIPIPENAIEISETDYELAFQEGKCVSVKDEVFVVEEAVVPTLKELQKQWRAALKSRYDNDRINLGTLIMMADDEDEEKELKAQKEVLKTKYNLT